MVPLEVIPADGLLGKHRPCHFIEVSSENNFTVEELGTKMVMDRQMNEGKKPIGRSGMYGTR